MVRYNKLAQGGMIIPPTGINDIVEKGIDHFVLHEPESGTQNPVDWAKRAQATICSYINQLGGGKIELHFPDIDQIVCYTDYARKQNPRSIIFRAGKKLEKKMKSMYNMNLPVNGDNIRMEYLIDSYGVSIYQGCD